MVILMDNNGDPHGDIVIYSEMLEIMGEWDDTGDYHGDYHGDHNHEV